MRAPAISLIFLLACDKDKGDDSADDTGTPAGWRPDLACPGDDGCASADGALEAGAGKASITPPCFESWEDLDGNGEYDSSTESFYDCGCDQLCEGDDGYTAPDEGEADGDFQAVWMAGFQTGRPASGVHDELWARTIALRQGDATLAIVSVDLVGYFNDEVLRVREEVAAAGLDVDHVIVSATHVHEGPDTMGLWGRADLVSGVDPEYMAYVRAQIVASVSDALAGLEPVTLTVGAISTAETVPEKGTRNLIRDSRDPVIIDEMLYVAHFAAADGSTVATLANWGNHPEALSDENTLLTSDFAHYIRESIESGVTYDSYSREGLGGVCVYLQGTVGGLMTPLGVEVTDGEGNTFSESNWDKAEAIGKVVGELALDAVEAGETVSDPSLAFRYNALYFPVDNFGFQAMALARIIDRETYNWDPERDIDEYNIPELKSEVDVVELGPVRILSVPGELFPELAVGGYDGSRMNTDQDEFISADNPNPPDVSAAPAGPYLKELMGGDYNWILGLGNDEVGYIVPAYDFKVHETLPYLDEPEGDHYEETNSLGPSTATIVDENAARLISWAP